MVLFVALIIMGYIIYCLRMNIFFYTHQPLLAITQNFLNGQDLRNDQYPQLYLIPKSFLFKQIVANFFVITWNPVSIEFLQYSGFIPYYLKQKKLRPEIVTCLSDISTVFTRNFIKSLYPVLSLNSQKNLLLAFFEKYPDLSMEMLCLRICKNTASPLEIKLINHFDPGYFIDWFEQKMDQPNFSYTFFTFLSVMEQDGIIEPLRNLLPKFSINQKLLLLDCITPSYNLDWLPLLNILEDDIPLVHSKAVTTRKELIIHAKNRGNHSGIQRREDHCKHFEQLVAYFFT